jgi:uncharacterized protein (DUF433 family)
MPNLSERVEVNAKILAGKPVVKGTRIPLYLVLELLEAGYDFKRIIEEYPSLTEDDIRAAIEYASLLMRNEEVLEMRVG